MNFSTTDLKPFNVILEVMKAAFRARKRQHVRFNPSTVTYAEIDFRSRADFKSQVVGFVFNEAYGGCGVVLPTSVKVREGDEIKIKVSNLSPVKAKVAWVRSVDDHVIKLGIEYLDL